MKLRVLGCHGGTSSTHHGVSFLVNDRLALDAGSLAAGLTIEEQSLVELVLLSHAHMDHVSDLGSATDLRSQQGGPPLVVAGLPETLRALQEHFFNDVLWPDFRRIPSPEAPALRLRELETEEPTLLLDLEVLAVRVDHAVPSCGFVVRQGDVAVAYSGDTGPTERFWQLVNASPTVRALVTEVSYPNRLHELAEVSGHLTPRLFEREIAKLNGRSDLAILVYGLKPLYEEEIQEELAALRNGAVEVVGQGALYEL